MIEIWIPAGLIRSRNEDVPSTLNLIICGAHLPSGLLNQETIDIHPMLCQCSPTVSDAGPTLNHHWIIPRFAGKQQNEDMAWINTETTLDQCWFRSGRCPPLHLSLDHVGHETLSDCWANVEDVVPTVRQRLLIHNSRDSISSLRDSHQERCKQAASYTIIPLE